MGREFTQEHIVKICLPPELYMAVTQFQVNKKIGKCYAGLLLITKAAYQEQLIGKEDYEKFVFRYSRRLVPEEQPKQLSPEQLNMQKKIEATARSFANVLDQWEQHPDPKWRQHWIDEAKKWQDKIPGAEAILQKANPSTGA
jgi:hypothetical protein